MHKLQQKNNSCKTLLVNTPLTRISVGGNILFGAEDHTVLKVNTLLTSINLPRGTGNESRDREEIYAGTGNEGGWWNV